MDCQPDSSYTVAAALESQSISPELPESELPFSELLAQTMNIDQIDYFGGCGQSGGGPWNSSFWHLSGNDPMLSIYDANQIEHQIETATTALQLDNIITSSMDAHSDYIALPNPYSLADIPFGAQSSFTVKYYFSPDSADVSNPCEWAYFDRNGFRVDNPTLLYPRDSHDLELSSSSLSSELVELEHSSPSSLSTVSASETVIPYPDHDYTFYNVEQPQPSPASPQVISSPNGPSIQLEQSNTEPSNLAVNLFSKNDAQFPDPVVRNKMELSLHRKKFPEKLWTLVNDPQYPQLDWSPDGRSIVFEPKLLEPILSKFSRNTKIHSFVRQLHMYGFSKTNRLPLKRDRSIPEVCKYQNQHFQRDHPELVDQIKRLYVNPFEAYEKEADQSGLIE